MSSALSNNKNPFLYILKSIEICNKSKDWMIDNNFTLCSTREGSKAQDAAVIQKWLSFCSHDLPKIDWNHVKITLLTFIHTSTELSEHAKQEFTTLAINNVLSYCGQTSPYKAIQLLVNQPKLNATELKMIEIALANIAAERTTYNYLLLWLCTEWHKTLLLELFENEGGFLKQCEDSSSFTIDWERCPKQTTDEFAIAARLVDAYNSDRKGFLSVMRQIKKEAIQSQEQPSQILHLWQTFISICDMERIKNVFMNILATTPGPFPQYWDLKDSANFFSEEVKRVFSLIANVSSLQPLSKATSRHEIYNRIAVILEQARHYEWQNQWLDSLYENSYITFESQRRMIKRYKVEAPPAIAGSRLCTPEEFAAMKLSSISLDLLETKIKKDFPTYLKQYLDEDEIYPLNRFFSYIAGTGQNFSIEMLRKKFCEKIGFSPTLELTKDLGALCIVSKAKPKKKTVKAQPIALPQPFAPKPLKGPSKFTVKESPLRLDCRVKDWYRPSPKAWEEMPYLSLPQNEKDTAKLLHSIPLVVTKILMQFIKTPEDWENRNHKLYRRPGTIHQYGINNSPIEGYFASCFTEDETLYHHFFHKIAFSHLIERYKQKASPPSIQEQQLIACDAAQLQAVAAGEVEINGITHVDNRFDIKRTTGSVIVDDTTTKIKYSICFPEWIASSST
jgi:hypothetical protein